MESIKQYIFARNAVLGTLAKAPEEKWDEMPGSSPNNIRWNAGHIFVSAEGFLHLADDAYKVANPEWGALFATGTRPSDWPAQVPSEEEITSALQEQMGRIERHFSAKLGDNASQSVKIGPLEMTTVEAVLQFVTFHEGMHTGIINSLSKVIR
ncbi:DinB family protein [Domibacillus tundrae]|uniref:DinB family protein n=1 Tax=Domibacillus tundrae TaxID=1587527 RepID=UPI0006180848|nr:DinB family protein [Domibacillus tundrae]